jgi:ComF family protein
MNGLNNHRKEPRLSNWKAAVLNQCAKVGRSVLPSSCVLCGVGTPDGRMCAGCDAELPRFASARCVVCALPLTSAAVCGACLDRPPSYDSVSAAYAYAFPVDALIHAYKYGGDLSLAPLLASALVRAPRPAVDAIIPMPLAPARLRERGFNQAHELARYLGRVLRLPVVANGCRKVTETPPQAALPWKERARNVRGAFVCDVDLAGLRVAIVDDVMTTGATLNELARNLKHAGALHVSGWVVARTLK